MRLLRRFRAPRTLAEFAEIRCSPPPGRRRVSFQIGWVVQRPSRLADVPGMAERKQPPIYSSREDDLALSGAIDSFVVSLAEVVDELQDADLDNDLTLLGQLATRLGARAESLGYGPLSAVASAVAAACRDEKLEDARAAMVELTGISGRIRRGHRGAA
jgi:hypothetical protein